MWTSKGNMSWPKGAASQWRDMADNDNRSVAMQMRDAREMMEWAASRSQDGAAWQQVCHAAMAQAQQTMNRNRPRTAN